MKWKGLIKKTMDLRNEYKKETGEEFDCVGYPTIGYMEWLEAKFSTDGCSFYNNDKPKPTKTYLFTENKEGLHTVFCNGETLLENGTLDEVDKLNLF